MKSGIKLLRISNVLTVLSIVAMLAAGMALNAWADDTPVLEVTPVFRGVTETEGITTFDVANTGSGTMEWTAETSESWLVIDSGSFGTDSGTITVSYETNAGEARTGTITVTATDATNSPQTVEMRQGVFGPRIVEYSPFAPVNMLTDTLDSVTVTFSEEIDYASDGSGSFALDDVIIAGPNGEITPTAIALLGDNKYEISFAAQTSLGTYTVSVGPDIADLVGNEMDQDRDGEFGESEDDVFIFSIIADEQERIFWEGFEAPDPEWEIDNGVWEIGEPTSGPGGAYNGLNCAATKLAGNYPFGPDSRLISPVMDLPAAGAGEELLLRFREFWQYASSSDRGDVQISVYENDTWSEWTTIDTRNTYSVVWQHERVDLTAYAGQRVRIAFYHVDIYEDPVPTTHHYENAGWYIDNIVIAVFLTPPEDVTNMRVNSFDDRVVLHWTHSADTAGDLAGYRVYFNDSPTITSLDAALNTFEVTGLAPASMYPVRVTSVDDDGNESAGAFTVAATLLPNPTNLTVEPFGGQVELSWSAVQPAELVKQYSIYAAESDFASVVGMAPRLLVAGTKTTTRLAGLTNGTTYYFAVAAVNLSGNDRDTVTTVSATPQDDIEGPEVSNIQYNAAPLTDGAMVTCAGTITLTVTDPSGVARVEFFVDGILVATDSNGSSDYSFEWDISAVEDGNHTLTITVYDTLGNSTSITYNLVIALPPRLLRPLSLILSVECLSMRRTSLLQAMLKKIRKLPSITMGLRWVTGHR